MLDSALERAYRESRYWIDTQPQRFFVQIDVPSEPLAALQRSYAVRSCGFITAWNPRSNAVARGANDAAQARLERDLRATGLAVLVGESCAADGSWPEPNFVVPGIDRDQLARLGRRYGQNAVVFAGADAVPRLVPLR